MLEYPLNGPRDEQNIDARATFLTAWLNRLAQKGDHISELRQKNLNYALIIFAALFTVSMKFPMPSAKPYSVCISLALLGIMIVFCVLDRRYHRYIHGWGETEKVITPPSLTEALLMEKAGPALYSYAPMSGVSSRRYPL